MFTLGLPSEDGAAQGLAIQAEQGGGVGVKLDGLVQANEEAGTKLFNLAARSTATANKRVQVVA